MANKAPPSTPTPSMGQESDGSHKRLSYAIYALKTPLNRLQVARVGIVLGHSQIIDVLLAWLFSCKTTHLPLTQIYSVI